MRTITWTGTAVILGVERPVAFQGLGLAPGVAGGTSPLMLAIGGLSSEEGAAIVAALEKIQPAEGTKTYNFRVEIPGAKLDQTPVIPGDAHRSWWDETPKPAPAAAKPAAPAATTPPVKTAVPATAAAQQAAPKPAPAAVAQARPASTLAAVATAAPLPAARPAAAPAPVTVNRPAPAAKPAAAKPAPAAAAPPAATRPKPAAAPAPVAAIDPAGPDEDEEEAPEEPDGTEPAAASVDDDPVGLSSTPIPPELLAANAMLRAVVVWVIQHMIDTTGEHPTEDQIIAGIEALRGKVPLVTRTVAADLARRVPLVLQVIGNLGPAPRADAAQ
jgi:hypothetical protein